MPRLIKIIISLCLLHHPFVAFRMENLMTRQTLLRFVDPTISDANDAVETIEEILCISDSFKKSDSFKCVEALINLRPNIKLASILSGQTTAIQWCALRSKVQIDSTELEEMYLGKYQCEVSEIAEKWASVLRSRLSLLRDLSPVPFGDGGKFQDELNQGIAIVQRASFLSRSLQKLLLAPTSSLSTESTSSQQVDKVDSSPVTIADFAVQAIILNHLKERFPSDKFIAEEDSSLLRSNLALCDRVIDCVQYALGGERWTRDKLFSVIDNGSPSAFSDEKMREERVWVLDPVDGTKGFVRGQHFCIALALVDRGTPVLSVLGCPNLNIYRVLQGVSGASKEGGDEAGVAFIDEPEVIKVMERGGGGDVEPERVIEVPPAKLGALFFAVTGRGAFARAISQPLGAAFEVSVSGIRDPKEAVLCESYEAAHGNWQLSSKMKNRLGMGSAYLRLDGQCKYCLVGAGAAEGNLRLPSAGYKEKIWDQVPGIHYIVEAGGRGTDLTGKDLDFGEGRYLNVTGIVASNGLLQTDLLDAVTWAKSQE